MPFIRTSRAKGKPTGESLPLLDLHIDRAGVRELAFTQGAVRGGFEWACWQGKRSLT
jgi:hypothetical protein